MNQIFKLVNNKRDLLLFKNKKINYDIYAKSEINGKRVTLDQHINDTLHALYCLMCNVNKFNYLKPYIEIVLTYHDVGKVLPYFQRKTINNEEYKPFDVYANVPHSLFSALMVDPDELKKYLDQQLPYTGKSETYVHFILSAIAYHHWRDNFFDIIEGYTDVFTNLKALVNNKQKWFKILINLNKIYSKINFANPNLLKLNKKQLDGLSNGITYSKYFTPPYLISHLPLRIDANSQINNSVLNDGILISGFTMICDHFASLIESGAINNITFKDIEIQGPDFNIIKNNISNELNNKIGKENNGNNIWQFNEVKNNLGKNIILLAPTGIGKTEFAYLWSNGEKMFYTLPLRTATNQIFERTQKIFGNDKVGLLHSDADLKIFEQSNSDHLKYDTESFRTYELSHQLSLPAIISTGDQFFPYALRPPLYERIFTKFAYSRLVIDEIQAYDPKSAAIIVKFIQHIYNMGGKFLLMTATLPEFIKNEIDKRTDNNDYITIDLFNTYDNLSSFSKHKFKFIIENYNDDEKKVYSDDLINTIIKKSLENDGKRVLVIMNTIKQAQEVYNSLIQNNNNIDIRLFHSRFTQNDRKTKENDLLDFIGNNDKSRDDKRAKILVATQVVEASLDIDADYLFTEIAPIDSLVQRMGRVLRQAHPQGRDLLNIAKNRYNINNASNSVNDIIPENVFIIIYKNEKNKNIYESGKGFVYDNELIKISIDLLNDKLLDNSSINDNKKYDEVDLSKLSKASKLLSEKEKSDLVSNLYINLTEKSEYLKQFYNMLSILDAGYMSDRKIDAQKIFRDISSVDVINEDSIEDLIKDINNFNFNNKNAYFDFKNEILNKYVISIQRNNKFKNYINDYNSIYQKIQNDDRLSKNVNFNILKNWLQGIYTIPLDYNSEVGLIKINKKE